MMKTISSVLDARTLLFVPGDRPEKFEKARDSGAQAIVVDLEDAVLPHAKDDARRALSHWLGKAQAAVVRVNSFGTPWFEDDIAASDRPSTSAIILPKATAEIFHKRAWPKPMIALIESAEGLATAQAIARHPDVVRLAFGALDFALDIDFTGPDIALDGFRLELVIASRLGNIAPPIDGVSVRIEDDNAAYEDTRRARTLGFSGKLCIHPRQLDPVRRAFLPTQEEIAWAKQIATAVSSKGASKIAGTMIDEPVRQRAKRILSAI